MTKLTHPDSKHSVDVSDDDLERYRSQGWLEPESKGKKDQGDN